ncbi:uncharacterized protein LOC114940982 [Nylanderia fulva]|uniref:uncharacterized protein LOC114940982 n=1 Tax=Nylanderia fulva TaxID=613905 RepID=UPI0010FB7F27|nr:uncharacterized protein LOC114940982 [Nylanderia fulva]
MKLGDSYDSLELDTFLKFISKQIRGLDDDNPSTSSDIVSGRSCNFKAKIHTANNASVQDSRKCPACSEKHLLFRCNQFVPLDIDQRFALAKKLKCCTNCLRLGHSVSACKNPQKCFKCDKAHHTYLHRDNKSNESTPSSDNRSADASVVKTQIASPTVLTASTCLPKNSTVLLTTAWVNLRTRENRIVRVRALLDQGATHTFITETLAQSLHTSRQRTTLPVTCFGERYSGTAKTMIRLSLEPCVTNDIFLPVAAYVFNRITSYGASKRSRVPDWPHLQGLDLADADPTDRTPIQILIGADLYGATLLDGLRKGPFGSPTAQSTIFGWIVTGPSSDIDSNASVCVATVNTMDVDLNQILVRFWETEEVPMKPSFTADEEKCEHHFCNTHARDESGRYIVCLPFKQFPPRIGDSRCIATRLYDRLERRLSRDASLATSYDAFFQEYLDLGHMELVTGPESSHDPVVYLPHHPVVKSESLSTKLRVVFNASCATSNKTSLNDHLYTGPKLQNNLMSILSRWRQHKYVYLADIEKMFRQIMVHPEEADYQRILWRLSSQASLQSYRLRTVTYGTVPAPYLAIRVLHQLVEDEGHRFPLARSILLHENYVDDILFGADDIDTANAMRIQLVNMLAAGRFCLRKWAANGTEMLEDVQSNDQAINMDHSLEEDNNIKVLGISWLPQDDSFSFHISLPPTAVATKRSILSVIARIFDPLGWATPVVIVAKNLMQELWIRTCGWDEPLPADLSIR